MSQHIDKESKYILIAVAELKTFCNREKERIRFIADTNERELARENLIKTYYAFYRLASFVSYSVPAIEKRFERSIDDAITVVRDFYDAKIRAEKNNSIRSEMIYKYRKCLQLLKDLKDSDINAVLF